MKVYVILNSKKTEKEVMEMVDKNLLDFTFSHVADTYENALYWATSFSRTHFVDYSEPTEVINKHGTRYWVFTQTISEHFVPPSTILILEKELITYNRWVLTIPNKEDVMTIAILGNQIPLDVEELDLSNMGLKELPAEIGLLVNLKTLDLSDNQLMSLPEGIGQLSQLQTLYLWGNRLTSPPPEVKALEVTGTSIYF